MAKLSEVLTEANWNKPRPAGVCILLAGWGMNMPRRAVAQRLFPELAAVAQRLFPDRCIPKRTLLALLPLAERVLIAFNDHPATTWDDVAKAIHTYEMEAE